MIYLDYSATTPIGFEVLDTYNKTSKDFFGNPNSLHELGVKSKNLMNSATKQIAEIFNIHEGEITYTGGATQANNMALIGAAMHYHKRGKHIIVSKLEHPSIYVICDYLFKKFKIKDEVEFFSMMNLDLLVITNGKKGAKFLYKENNQLQVVDKTPSIIVDAVDTSGAGDAFFSTVIREYAYCKKIDKDFIDKTFELANKSSRDIIAQVGSRKTQ